MFAALTPPPIPSSSLPKTLASRISRDGRVVVLPAQRRGEQAGDVGVVDRERALDPRTEDRDVRDPPRRIGDGTEVEQ